GDEGAGLLADLLQDSSALLSLDLTFNLLQTGGAKSLAAALQSNSSLLSLTLSGNQIGPGGGVAMAAMLQVNNTLQELQLADCHLDTQGVVALSVALTANRASRYSVWQEEWAGHVAHMLAVNGSLLELHLGRAGLSDSGAELLAEGLKENHCLRYLDLRCNRVTADGVRLLADLLKYNRSLEILDLSSNRMEDEGAAHLSDSLRRPGCCLKELSVCRNNMGSQGLRCLCEALKTSRTVTHLFLWGNLLDEAVCQLVSQLMSSGRLLPENTDVSPYLVDGRVFLAEGPHCLRKRLHRTHTEETSPPHTH
uniref:Leucine rich repeat containing 34 n=1 Tax=Salarias fasciatus TaxID=181472 RepID=A0A672HJP8_SALFA